MKKNKASLEFAEKSMGCIPLTLIEETNQFLQSITLHGIGPSVKEKAQELKKQWMSFLPEEQSAIIKQNDVTDHKKAQDIFHFIEQAITMDKCLRLFNSSWDKAHLVRPLKLIYLEHDMSLVGEDRFDKCLTAIKLSEIQKCELMDSWKSQSTELDVENFVRGIRSIAEIETRLILKIKNPEFFEVQPQHHFLAKPCMITNPEGDLIWSAYVEQGEPLFDWLITLGKQVEILDPTALTQLLKEYQRTKKKKVA